MMLRRQSIDDESPFFGYSRAELNDEKHQRMWRIFFVDRYLYSVSLVDVSGCHRHVFVVWRAFVLMLVLLVLLARSLDGSSQCQVFEVRITSGPGPQYKLALDAAAQKRVHFILPSLLCIPLHLSHSSPPSSWARGLGERCKLPQWSPGRSPGAEPRPRSHFYPIWAFKINLAAKF